MSTNFSDAALVAKIKSQIIEDKKMAGLTPQQQRDQELKEVEKLQKTYEAAVKAGNMLMAAKDDYVSLSAFVNNTKQISISFVENYVRKDGTVRKRYASEETIKTDLEIAGYPELAKKVNGRFIANINNMLTSKKSHMLREGDESDTVLLEVSEAIIHYYVPGQRAVAAGDLVCLRGVYDTDEMSEGQIAIRQLEQERRAILASKSSRE